MLQGLRDRLASVLHTVVPDGGTLPRLRSTIWGAMRGWSEHQAASRGAALSFYTLFSLAPILVLVISIAGLFFGAEAARGELFAQISGLIGETGAAAVQGVLAATQRTGGGVFATLAAIGMLVIGATTVFAELKSSLDAIWETREQVTNGIWAYLRKRVLSFGLVLVLAFLLLVSLAVNAALVLLQHYWSQLWTQSSFGLVAEFFSALFSFGTVTLLFAVIFRMLPPVRVTWRDVLPGALITTLLFQIGKRFIGLYLGNSAVASSYGAAGSVVALMLWVYYSAQIFFFGAELTRQYALQFGSLRITGEAVTVRSGSD
jgi:membrane protein